MNLKDRLENIKSANVLSIKESEEYSLSFDVEQVFLDSDDVKRILIQSINEGKNIVFVSNPTIESSLIAKYFQKLFYSEEKAFVFNKDLLDENLCSEDKINFISSQNMSVFVRILEKIMYGCGTCILGITLKNSDYALDKIKASIALNCSNLSNENIEILLGTSDLVLVNFNKNSDGLYFVSKIDKVTFENYKTDTLVLFDSVHQNPQVKIEKPVFVEERVHVEQKEEIDEAIFNEEKEENSEVVEVVPHDEVTILENEKVVEQTSDEISEIETNEDNKKTVKKNKYAMLKEKVKRKKVVVED
ncbi:MAG: hypothetical protein IJY61_02565 [Candidatus Gastranaerophilales bacterium]|nr:hypothetical protein [Candidatus Gastranaerophilales bacterium]